MGFTPQRRVYKLVFEDDQYAGLEVSARSASVGAYQDIAELSDVDVRHLTAEDRARVDRLVEAFGEHLVAWNVEDDAGEPVAATSAGLRSQELPFVFDVIKAWMQAVAGVDPTLGNRSDVAPAADLDLPMEILTN